MKAIVWTKYGPPEGLQLQEVKKPVPKDNEVLIRIHATTVTAGDCEMRSLKLPLFLSLPTRMYVGLRRPARVKIIGQEMAGEIEAVGKDVISFKEGDQVFGATSFGQGTYCEYICLPESSGGTESALAIKPANLSYEEAAAIPVGGLEALHFLRKANIQAGEKVLINGAGGSIGTIGIQLARHYGAEVTAVDSAEKLDMLRSIGAEHVVDYRQEDFTRNGLTYDVIFDVVGKSPFSRSLRSLKPNGRYLLSNPKLSEMVRGPWVSSRGDKKVIVGAAGRKAEDLIFLKELIEGGKIKIIIDRSYALEEIAEAHRYVESGQKKGNVVLTFEPATTS